VIFFRCRCFKSKIICSSRCHSGKNKACKNLVPNTITSQTVFLPRSGGSANHDGNEVKFINTCILDSWLTLLKMLLRRFPFLLEHNSYSRELKQTMDLVLIGHYNEIKLHVSVMNNLILNDGFFNLFENEFILFLQPLLSPSLKHQLVSRCTSPFCSNPEEVLQQSTIPSVNLQSETPVTTQLVQWFSGNVESTCKRPMTVPTKDLHTHWDVNSETGYMQFCNYNINYTLAIIFIV